MKVRKFVLACIATLLLAACGGSGGGTYYDGEPYDSEYEYVDPGIESNYIPDEYYDDTYIPDEYYDEFYYEEDYYYEDDSYYGY